MELLETLTKIGKKVRKSDLLRVKLGRGGSTWLNLPTAVSFLKHLAFKLNLEKSVVLQVKPGKGGG